MTKKSHSKNEPSKSTTTSAGADASTRWPINKLVQLTGLDAERILKIQKLGYFPSPKKGEYETVPTIKGLFRYLTETADKTGRPKERDMKLPIYNSMTICQAATGIPMNIQSQAKREGCPAFPAARVDLGLLLKWLYREDQEKSQDSPVGHRTELDKWKAAREKQRYEKEAGLMVDRTNVTEGLKAGMAEFFATVERVFCSELPPELVGMRELAVRERCRMEINAVKEQARQRFLSIAEEDPDDSSEDESSTESEESKEKQYDKPKTKKKVH